MKIDPTSNRPAASRRIGGSSLSPGQSDFAKSLREDQGHAGAGAIGSPAGLGGLAAVLAVQETPDQLLKRSRQRARERGEDVLDQLDDIRLGLLTGAIPVARLERLAQLIRAKREQVDDPRLDQILDEIELRAAVELAKLSRP
jgi:hypothetical protein